MTADVTELMRLAADLQESGANIAPKVRSGITKARNNLRDFAEANAPVGETGDLKAGFETEGTGFEQRVVNHTRQAFFQQFGTSRHPPQPVLLDYEERTADDGEKQVYDALGRLL